MNACIIVHSSTGTTLKFAKIMKGRLESSGHSVNLVELQTNVPVKTGSIRQPMNFEITNIPDITDYEVILAGGPVWAFSISTVIYKCLETIPEMRGKKFLPFVTMGFPLPGMGGKGSLNLLGRMAKQKGAELLPGAIACKMFHDIDKMMESEAARIVSLLK